jgi:pimeloyl-ACP methyl ester carboxylesterase
MPAKSSLRQEVRFCTAADGARIAYAVVGEGPPLVKAANWLNHLEYDWESPVWHGILQTLAAENRLIRHDQRGNGLSDWEVDDISFEAFVSDLESVVDAAGVEKFALLGMSQGCAVSIAYAVRHPERVTRLVLYGGFARGRRKRGSQAANDEADALNTLIRAGWGQENPAFRQIFTSQFIPGGTVEQVNWFNDLQRVTTSPENAVRIMEAMAAIDVTDLLPQVSVPTLVLHCRHDARADFEEGRLMAAGIPGARFVALEGKNHVILETEPAFDRFFEEVGNFLKS